MPTATTVTAPVRITRKRAQTLTDAMLQGTTLAERRAALRAGYDVGTHSDLYRDARRSLIATRVAHGFAMAPAPLLSEPSSNVKLAKGATPAYGLTLQSFRSVFADGTRVNACPDAGQCVRVCVLNRGKGALPDVQRARDYRTEFVARHTLAALIMIGAELRRAVDKWGAITFRPNVNSDVLWSSVVGDGLTTLPGVTSYGYTKRPMTDDRPSGLHHEARSFSERSDWIDAAIHARSGGTVAIVTNRRPGEPIEQWHPTARVVDADATDEWMFTPGVFGDLSFKSDRPADRSFGFVQHVY